jgi:predicted MFS family arabinose efflux permease
VSVTVAGTEQVHSTAAPYLKRNFFLGMANGSLYMLAETLVDASLVLTWFLARLAAPNILIGLVVPLRDAGWFLPQLFVAPYLGRLRYKMPTYASAALIRGMAWMAMAVVVLTQRNPTVLIMGFFIPYVVNSFASGWAGLAFMDIIAKTIPAERRGAYFGTRMLIGGLLGIAGSYVVRLALGEQLGQTFPANVGQLTAIAGVFAVISLMSFTYVVEPPGEVSRVTNLFAHLGQAWHLPRRDRNFGFFPATRVALMAAQMATPFLAVYASRELGAGAEMVSLYLAANTAAALASNLVWSRISDRQGNRAVLRFASGIGLMMALLAWLIGPIGWALKLTTVTAWLFSAVFALVGVFQSGIGLGGMSLLLEIAPAADRGLYIGLANTVLGIALMSTSIGGILVDWLGYRGLFLLAAGCYAIGLWAATLLHEPRRLSNVRSAR